MSQEQHESSNHISFNRKQQLFIRYFTAILIDLTVINLFDEYWDLVKIESFTISLLTAILLQVLLQITVKIEHKVGAYCQEKFGKIARLLSAWAILFVSKLIILETINISFGEKVQFTGPVHGLVAFIVVIIVMIIAEIVIIKINKSL